MMVARPPTIRSIQELTAKAFDIPLIEMRSKRRARIVARPRQVAMYLAKRLTPHSMPTIARAFNKEDHTTVMHAIKVVEKLREINGFVEKRRAADGLIFINDAIDAVLKGLQAQA